MTGVDMAEVGRDVNREGEVVKRGLGGIGYRLGGDGGDD